MRKQNANSSWHHGLYGKRTALLTSVNSSKVHWPSSCNTWLHKAYYMLTCMLCICIFVLKENYCVGSLSTPTHQIHNMHNDENFCAHAGWRVTKTLHACSDCTSVIPNQSSVHISQTLKSWLDAWLSVASAIRISGTYWMLSTYFFFSL